MRKYIILSLTILSLFGMAVFSFSNASTTVCFPSQGCTGTGTLPGKGSLLVGASSTAYGLLATSTNGKVLTSSSTATLGVSWETSAAGSGTLSGNGTSTQIAFYTGLQTLSSSLSLFWDNVNNRLGVGTSTPAYPLHVIGTSTASGGFWVGPGFATYPEYSFISDPNTGLDSSGPDIMNLVNAGLNTITLTAANKVGIGTTTPATTLVVNGAITQTSLGTGLLKSNSGLIGMATSGTDYAPATSGSSILKGNGSGGFSSAVSGVDYQPPITFPIPVASTSLGVSPGPSLVLSGNTITLAQQINSTSSPQFLGATTTNLLVTHATTTDLSFAGDGTKLTTAFVTRGANVYNASTTQNGASSTIITPFPYVVAKTIVQVFCSTDGSSVSIAGDIRASSTPNTYGTGIFANGAVLSCTSSGTSTTAFSNASIPIGDLVNWGIISTPNATTTLRLGWKEKEQ